VDQATACHRPAQVRPKLECFGLDLTPPVLLSAFPLLHQIRFYPPQIIIRLSRSVLARLSNGFRIPGFSPSVEITDETRVTYPRNGNVRVVGPKTFFYHHETTLI
jgi:hypothetical protein